MLGLIIKETIFAFKLFLQVVGLVLTQVTFSDHLFDNFIV